MVRVPNDALEIRGNTETIRLKNVAVVDSFTFYDPFPPFGNVPAMTSFEMSYTRSGSPRQVQSASTDPTSPFNWAGEMWMATGSVAFSVAYQDGSFAVHGSAGSTGSFGEMGIERNGIFVQEGEK